jgi:predicted DNA-binding transcriptional regulator YafY
VVGYCHLREDVRTFRLDRIEDIALTDTAFVPPPDFDALLSVEESIARMPLTWRIDVVLHATMEEARSWFPPASAFLTPDPGGVAASYYIDDLDAAAMSLAQLPCTFEIRGPAEIRLAFSRLAQRIARMAEA